MKGCTYIGREAVWGNGVTVPPILNFSTRRSWVFISSTDWFTSDQAHPIHIQWEAGWEPMLVRKKIVLLGIKTSFEGSRERSLFTDRL